MKIVVDWWMVLDAVWGAFVVCMLAMYAIQVIKDMRKSKKKVKQ